MKYTLSSLINVSVVIITFLLVVNIVLTNRNNRTIEENKKIQELSESIKHNISLFAIVIIHNLDLGLRGYALYEKEKYLFPMKFALRDKDSLMNAVERQLLDQQYPIAEFLTLKDSINSYAQFSVAQLERFRKRDLDEFYRLSDQDRGYHLWLQYERFANNVFAFEEKTKHDALLRYQSALRMNFLIQIVLMTLCVPTLLVAAYNTSKKFAVEKKLNETEREKATILSSQNKILEQAVKDRTEEIEEKNKLLQAQFDEIAAQNEEISAQNDELNRHRDVLTAQNLELKETKKRQLELYKQNLMEKSEIISQITTELESLRKQFSPDREHIHKLTNILAFSILTDEDWERFKKTFQEVYPDFFVALRYRFPSITASELRLAALIKMNLSLKEAAGMLGISSSSVRKSRYRLKKRLGLQDEQSLEDFLSKL